MGLVVIAAVTVIWSLARGGRSHDVAPSWSADGHRLVFVSGSGDTGPWDLFVMNADGTERHQLTFTAAREHLPSFSPDGRWVVFEQEENGRREIRVMDVSGGESRSVSKGRVNSRMPVWSPDSKHIVFASDDRQPSRFDIFKVGLDGSHESAVTTGAGCHSPQVTSDGRIAAVCDGNVAVIDQLGHVTPLTYGGRSVTPGWSPDGSQIVFASRRGGPGPGEIFVMGADGSAPRVVVSMAGASLGCPRWSPDGRRVAFVSAPMNITPETADTAAIYIIDLQTERVARISH